MRFVLIGDTHFCAGRIRGEDPRGYALEELPDHLRYSWMTRDVVEPMFREIRALKPDFVISTGDFVEGGMGADPEKTGEEISQGLRFMEKLGAPFFIARGTHEGSDAYRQLVMPEVSKHLPGKPPGGYYRFDRGSCAFMILDYLEYFPGGEQDVWLESELDSACGSGKSVFVCAHAPLYNWGRHFFTEPVFAGRLRELCAEYPVSAYLCGHTHNQAVSFHETDGGRSFMQVMASSVGYPLMKTVPLEDVHSVARFSPADCYAWGIAEDSSPGFYLFQSGDDGGLNVQWTRFDRTNTASVFLEAPGGKPSQIFKPRFHPHEKKLREGDIRQIKCACVHVYGIYRDCRSACVSVNGEPSGNLPGNTSWASRRCITLGREALRKLGRKNVVSIRTPSEGEYAIGSVSLELMLWDGRVIRSCPAPEVFVCGPRWDGFLLPVKTRRAGNAEEIRVELFI